jgi:serine/threonine protein kinase
MGFIKYFYRFYLNKMSEVPLQSPWERYKGRRRIGGGTTSVVASAYSTQPDGSLGEKVLIKTMLSDFTQIGTREADIMPQIPSHPLLCGFRETFLEAGRRYIVMEFCEGDDMKKYLTTNGIIDPKKIMQIMLQISSAIAHLHVNLIIHGDIKPANIMINEKADGSMEIKLCDFGFSRNFADVCQGIQGTPLYFSPEIVNVCNVDSGSDVWASGVMMLHMLTGVEKPFFLHAAKNARDVKQILLGLSFETTPFPPELLQNEDPNVVFLARIAQRCLSLDRSQRPRAQEIVAELTGKIAELGDA